MKCAIAVYFFMILCLFQAPILFKDIRMEQYDRILTHHDRDVMLHSSSDTYNYNYTNDIFNQFSFSGSSSINNSSDSHIYEIITIWGDYVIHTYLYIYSSLLWAPLLQLYLNGPSCGGYGFWEGKSRKDICSSLIPASDALLWNRNMEYCHDLVLRRMDGFIITCHFSLLLIFVYICFQYFQCYLYRITLERWLHINPSPSKTL